MSKQLFLIETVSKFKHQYVIEVEEGQPIPEFDISDLEEMSQEWLSESLVSQKVITPEEYLVEFNTANDYLSTWTDENKLRYINQL